jgi:hypothetical protein
MGKPSRGEAPVNMVQLLGTFFQSRSKRDVFQIVPVLMERVNSLTSILPGVVHGNDLSNYTWLFDDMSWHEGHMVMLRMDLLAKHHNEYFALVQYLSEWSVVVEMMNRWNYTSLRSNEVHVVFDLCRNSAADF